MPIMLYRVHLVMSLIRTHNVIYRTINSGIISRNFVFFYISIDDIGPSAKLTPDNP